MRKPSRQQVLLTPRLTLTAGQQWWQNAGNTGGAFAANPEFHCLGQRRLVGSVYSSVAGTLQVQFGPDGTNWPDTETLVVDPNNAGSYVFDFDLFYPFFRFVVTDAGAGSTVQIEASVYEEGSGGSLSGGGPSPPAPTKDAPYTVLGFGQTTTLNGTVPQTLATIAGGSVPAGTTAIFIQAGTGLGGDTSVVCLWRADGTVPTATVGQTLLLGVGLVIPLVPASLANFKIVGSSAGPSTVRCTFMSQ